MAICEQAEEGRAPQDAWRTAADAGGRATPKVHDGWMWDLTVPGNNDHDFYVLAVPVPGKGAADVRYPLTDDAVVLARNAAPGQNARLFLGRARTQSRVSRLSMEHR